MTSVLVITERVPLEYNILYRIVESTLLYTSSLPFSPFYLYFKAKIAVNVISGFFSPYLNYAK